MTKLKTETNKVETAIAKLKGELQTLNKGNIEKTINDKQTLIKLFEELLENDEIQKRYPKYNKIKKVLYILPSLLVALLTIALIVASIIIGNITFTTFLPMILIAADFLTYHYSTMICDKKITENEMYKPYNDIYGDKQYSAKRTLKDLHEAEKDLSKNKELLEECNEKESHLQNLQSLLARLNEIRDNYIEQTLQEDYSKEEIEEISTLFTEATRPKVYTK